MKKIFVSIILSLLLIGCDSIKDDVVSNDVNRFGIESINAPNYLSYSAGDSVVTIRAVFTSALNLKSVWGSVVTTTSKETIIPFFALEDNGNLNQSGDQTAGDNIFSGRFVMSNSYASGDYIVEVYTEDIESTRLKSGFHSFSFENGQSNIAPVISNATAPDTVVVVEPKTVFLISVEVADSNGYADIKEVWYTVRRPNGTTSGNRFFLLDNGTGGDITPFDGVFSQAVEVVPSNAKGRYTFTFQAADKGNKLSNTLTYYIVLE